MHTSYKSILIASVIGVVAVFVLITPALAATCPRQPLKTSPMHLGDFTNILPLGNLNPPDHTIPTDHIYFLLPNDAEGNITVKNVYAPSTITITSIGRSTYYQDTTTVAEDYSIEFKVCDQLSGRLGHVSSVVSAIKTKLTRWDYCQTYPISSVGNKVKQCTKRLSLTIKNGTKIGTVGGKISHALDLWTYDTRVNIRSKFVNPARYVNTMMFNTTCSISYFSSTVFKQLVPLLGNQNAPRTKYPRCGTFAPDKAGTLQGNWFTANAKDDPAGWKKELSLTYDNRDGTTSAISIGGVITTAGVHYFSPTKTGLFNRAFETVTPSSRIYCYQADYSPTKHFLIRLVDTKTLQIEKQDGTCIEPYTFARPYTYKR